MYGSFGYGSSSYGGKISIFRRIFKAIVTGIVVASNKYFKIKIFKNVFVFLGDIKFFIRIVGQNFVNLATTLNLSVNRYSHIKIFKNIILFLDVLFGYLRKLLLNVVLKIEAEIVKKIYKFLFKKIVLIPEVIKKFVLFLAPAIIVLNGYGYRFASLVKSVILKINFVSIGFVLGKVLTAVINISANITKKIVLFPFTLAIILAGFSRRTRIFITDLLLSCLCRLVKNPERVIPKIIFFKKDKKSLIKNFVIDKRPNISGVFNKKPTISGVFNKKPTIYNSSRRDGK